MRGLLLALIVVAGCGSSESQSSAIINGDVTLAYPAVGQLTASRCTATLIHRQAILTAAHCVKDELGAFMVEGPDGELFVEIRHFEVHAGYAPSLGPGRVDLALGILAHPIELDVPAIRTTPVRAGQPVRLVGYGKPAADERGGTKRTGLADVDQANAVRITLRATEGEAQTCPGDSGSPYLDPDTGEIFAVHSSGQCSTGGPLSYGVHLLMHRPWIHVQLHRHLRDAPVAEHPLVFDPELYGRLHPEVAAEGLHDHWRSVGLPAGERGSAMFDPAFYRRTQGLGLLSNQELAAHWLEVGLPTGAAGSEEVDPPWLVDELAEWGWPLADDAYLTACHHLGAELLKYRASKSYDPDHYLSENTDWWTDDDRSYHRALVHYLTIGKAEGRPGAAD